MHSVAIDGTDLWHLNLDPGAAEVTTLASLLSPDERSRAQRFAAERDRRRFVVARGRLRQVLGDLLGTPPGAVRLAYGSHGKPRIEDADNHLDLRFNVSHTADHALLATTLGREVGVDIERVRTRVDIEGIAARFFAPGEVQRLSEVAPAQRREAFFACWTRKEAFLKAIGEGIPDRLNAFEVSLEPQRAALLRIDWDPEEVNRWDLHAIVVDAGLVAALAVAARP